MGPKSSQVAPRRRLVRSRYRTVAIDDQGFSSTQGGSKKDINQERFKLIKMEAKKLLDNNKEIIKKIEKKHNIKILKNSKAIKKTDVQELGDVMISELSGLSENKIKLN